MTTDTTVTHDRDCLAAHLRDLSCAHGVGPAPVVDPGPYRQARSSWLDRVLDAQAVTAGEHGDAAQIDAWRERAAARVGRVAS